MLEFNLISLKKQVFVYKMNKKCLKLIILLLFVLLMLAFPWFRQLWIIIWVWLNDKTVTTPPRLEVLFSALIAFFLVFVVEFLRSSKVVLKKSDPLNVKKDSFERKFLKIEVLVNKRWFFDKNDVTSRILPPYVHSQSSVLAHINHCPKRKFRVKWDNAPEPIEYPHSFNVECVKNNSEAKNKKNGNVVFKVISDGFPRVEKLPMSMQAENLLPGDKIQAAVLVKHRNESGFYIFDPEYYFDSTPSGKNYCDYKIAYLKLVFRSSLSSDQKYFKILNPGKDLDNFDFKEISKEDYESSIIE